MQQTRNAAPVLRRLVVMNRVAALLVLIACLSVGRAAAQQITVAGAQLAPLFGTVGSPVVFTAVPLSGTVLNYQWDFGDGQQGAGPTTSHTYTYPGIYTVTLTAQGGAG